MMNQFDVTRESPARPQDGSVGAAWVKPSLERLSLKEALSGGTHGADGTHLGDTTFS